MDAMEDLKKSYSRLLERAKDLLVLQSAGMILHWDMETKMPPKGVELRSQQLALLQRIAHQMLTSPETDKAIKEVEKHPGFEGLREVERRNVYLARKAYEEATRLPEDLVVEIARQSAVGVNVWKRAKAKSDWSLFEPELEKIKALMERKGELLMEVKGTGDVYDALIDDYEPRMRAEQIARVFEGMRRGLQRVMDWVLSQEQPDVGFLSTPVPVEIQERIGEKLAEFMLYDVKSEEAGGRIDTTEHPFTVGYYTDVRITTKYHEDRVLSSIYSILHEGGHALYEQGLPLEWMYQPVGSSASYGIHESMSRFVENLVGKSPEFWEFFLPVFQGLTGDRFKDVDVGLMARAANLVTPSKIRIEADEVTYGLHIVIRFEIERALFSGGVEVGELPQVWNDKYEEYLGVEVENDAEGVLQDTHWSGGSFGYFPSYALGNIYDGMWLEKLNRDLPGWRGEVAQGVFQPVKEWLTDNVYRYGNLYDPEDLVRRVTGKGLEVAPFINYLEEKFNRLYS